MKTPPSWLTHYALSVAIVTVVIAIKSFVLPAWSLAHPYLSFYPAIILAGWYGGFGPGVLATLPAADSLSYLCLPPPFSLRYQGIKVAPGLLLFVSICFATSPLTKPPPRSLRPPPAPGA